MNTICRAVSEVLWLDFSIAKIDVWGFLFSFFFFSGAGVSRLTLYGNNIFCTLFSV